MNYEAMLKKARNELPDDLQETHRFEIPKVRGHLQGNKTVINNLIEIAKLINRPIKHVLKFIQKEVASPGNVIKQSVIFGSKIPSSQLNEKIEKYAEIFVFCKECGKPETTLSKDGDVIILKCNACGAKYPVKQ